MKELSIEQKAKAYDEAVERAKYYQKENGSAVISAIFPELAKSEDERIRKAIIKMIADIAGGFPFEKYGILKKEALAWLEKQGEQNLANSAKTCKDEQKPAEWSEDDQSSYNEICNLIYDNYRAEDASKLLTWFNELKDRVLPQPKQEWSEEDMNMLQSILDEYKSMPIEKRNWLKSLRHQSTWKPSTEQMRVLDLAIRCGINRGTTEETTLVSLFNNLKKLREE